MPKGRAKLGYFVTKDQPRKNADNVCVLVVHYNFEKTKDESWIREGDAQDVENLEKTFRVNRNCKFHSILSPEKGKLLQLLADQEEIIKLFGCPDVPSVFVLYILSHGDTDGKIFTDHYQKEDQKDFICFTTTEIFESLKKLTAFEECLKFINFGPCRGELIDSIFFANHNYVEFENENSCRITYSPMMKNTVVFFSTVETTKAKRDQKGTTFALLTCKVLDSLEKDESLINVLTNIQNEIHKVAVKEITGQTPEVKMFSQDRSFVFSKSSTNHQSSSTVEAKIVKIKRKCKFYSWKSSSGENLRHRLVFLFSATPNGQFKEIKRALAQNLDFETSERMLTGNPWTSINEASRLDSDIGCIFLIFFGLVSENKETNEVCVEVDGKDVTISEILREFIGPKNDQWIGKPKILFLVNQETSSFDNNRSKQSKMEILATNHSGWLVLVLHNKEELQKLIEIFKGQELKKEKSLQELLASLLISESKENRDLLNSTLQYLLNFPDWPRSFVKPNFSVKYSQKNKEYDVSFDSLVKKSAKEKQIWLLRSVAGKGKTTILREMAFQLGKLNPDLQILRISLPRVSFGPLKRNVTEFDFLANATHISKEEISKQIENKQCVVILDGFDEIRIENQKKVLKVIEALEKRQLTVWVGTRPHAAEAIQKRIPRAVLVKIYPLNYKQQIKFLKLETGKSREDSELFIKNFASRDILENPLHLSLVAKYGAEGNLYQIYHKVVRHKVEDSLINKGFDKNNKVKFKEELDIALDRLQQLASCHITEVELNDDTRKELEKFNCYGIATFENNKVIFIHQTFAEFLAAQHFLLEIDVVSEYESRTSAEDSASILYMQSSSWFIKFVNLFYCTNEQKIEEHKASYLPVMKLNPDRFLELIVSGGCINIFKMIYQSITFSNKREGNCISVAKDKTLLVKAIRVAEQLGIMMLDTDLIESDEELLIILPYLLKSVAESNACVLFENLKRKFTRLPELIRSRRLFIDAGVIAARNFHSEILHLLLQNGVDKDFQGDEGSGLYYAISNRAIKCVEILLKHDAKLAIDKNGKSWDPLILAIEKNDLDLVKLLLEENISGLQRNKETFEINEVKSDMNALNFAIRRRHTEIAKFMFEKSPRLKTLRNGKEGRLLKISAKYEYFEMCQWLVDEAKVDVNTLRPSGEPRDWSRNDEGTSDGSSDDEDTSDGSSDVEDDNICMDYFLLLQKTDIDMTDERGKTPLHCAAERGYLERVQQLIHAKANVRAVDKNGWNAFHFACKSNSDRKKELFQLLHSTDNQLAKEKTKSGQTGLHIFLNFFNRPLFIEVARFLVQEIGIDVKARDENGWNAFHSACSQYDEKVIRLLHNTDSQLAKDKTGRGQTGLHILMESSEYCSEDEARFLVEEIGVDVRAEDNNGRTALDIALDKRNSCVDYLMTKDINWEAINEQGQTYLHLAAEKGDLEALQTWIEMDGDLDDVDKEGLTALHIAAERGDLQFVEKLLACAAKNQDIGNGSVGSTLKENLIVNRCDNEGRTALHLAVKTGNVDLVEILLKNNADINLTDIEGMNAIHYAFEDERMLRFLNEKNGDLVKQCTQDGIRTLHFLSMGFYNEEDMNPFRWIVEQDGIDLNKKNASGDTLLSLACQGSYWNVAKELLTRNVDFNISDKSGKTAMHYAAENGNLSFVRLLHEKGADLTLRDNKGMNAIHLAAKTGDLSLVKLFLEKGADLTLRDSKGMNALHHAIENFVVFSFLHEKDNALLRERLKNGDTTLHLALKTRHIDTGTYLWLVEQFENDLNVTNSEGETPLLLACKWRKLNFANFLLQKGVEVHVKDKKGRMALHYAVKFDGDKLENFDLVQGLCKRGADLALTDNEGMNAFHHAITNFQMALFIHELNGDLVKQRLNNGDTTLHLAIKLDRDDNILIWLLEQCENNLSVSNSDGETPLMLACKQSRWILANILVAKGADIHVKDKNGRTALHYAMNLDKDHALAFVQELCKKGADLALTDNDGMNAFHHAITNEKIALFIHELNGDLVKQRLNNGDTSLHLAIKLYRHSGINNILIWLVKQCENDLNITNSKGETPLLLACKRRNENIANTLVAKGADINAKDKKGRMALHYAVKFNDDLFVDSSNESDDDEKDDEEQDNEVDDDEQVDDEQDDNEKDDEKENESDVEISDLVKELREKDADFALTDNNGKNAFHHAMGNFHMALFIHELNGDLVKQRLKNGDTTLHLAIKKFRIRPRRYGNEILMWLVEQGDVDLNARNALNETPLILACKRRLWECKFFETLLSKNVDVNIRDNEGNSARDYIDESCPNHLLRRFDELEEASPSKKMRMS